MTPILTRPGIALPPAPPARRRHKSAFLWRACIVRRKRRHSAHAIIEPHTTLCSLNGGDAERYVADLAIALRSRGWDVEVACSVAGVQAAPLRASNMPLNVLVGSLVKQRLSLRYVRALRRLLVQGRYDVVHAHLYASAAAAAEATPRNTSVVLTEHTEAPWRSWRHRP